MAQCVQQHWGYLQVHPAQDWAQEMGCLSVGDGPQESVSRCPHPHQSRNSQGARLCKELVIGKGKWVIQQALRTPEKYQGALGSTQPLQFQVSCEILGKSI